MHICYLLQHSTVAVSMATPKKTVVMATLYEFSLHIKTTGIVSMDTLLGQSPWTLYWDSLHGHSTGTVSMDTLLGQSLWQHTNAQSLWQHSTMIVSMATLYRDSLYGNTHD